uniref:SecY-independent transporter protein n=1 Tax=Glaucosphaera vacuolata TaxID=38265 RepID=UPI001FCCCB53|nr:SecY-independent transporter protein [Glaucosphaera vacuolata]UNJ18776.1 SecY-independent transporter protein [Glaucosphaera vacuolata]
MAKPFWIYFIETRRRILFLFISFLASIFVNYSFLNVIIITLFYPLFKFDILYKIIVVHLNEFFFTNLFVIFYTSVFVTFFFMISNLFYFIHGLWYRYQIQDYTFAVKLLSFLSCLNVFFCYFFMLPFVLTFLSDWNLISVKIAVELRFLYYVDFVFFVFNSFNFYLQLFFWINFLVLFLRNKQLFLVSMIEYRKIFLFISIFINLFFYFDANFHILVVFIVFVYYELMVFFLLWFCRLK